jgi:ribosomal protein S18 acetylase RimI-like enzyme
MPVDQDLFADLWTSFYTDSDARATSVIADGDVTMGYLTGALNEHSYRRAMPRIVLAALIGAAGRGNLFSSRALAFIMINGRLLWEGSSHRADLRADYPAHFHINLESKLRGAGWGRRLVERFLEQASSAGVSGVRGAVAEANARACGFLESLGFLRLDRQRTFALDEGRPAYKIVYGRRL